MDILLTTMGMDSLQNHDYSSSLVPLVFWMWPLTRSFCETNENHLVSCENNTSWAVIFETLLTRGLGLARSCHVKCEDTRQCEIVSMWELILEAQKTMSFLSDTRVIVNLVIWNDCKAHERDCRMQAPNSQWAYSRMLLARKSAPPILFRFLC